MTVGGGAAADRGAADLAGATGCGEGPGGGCGAPPSTNGLPHFGQFTFDPAGNPGDFIVPWQCGQAIFGSELAVDMNT
jgi:hypothetical protein